MQVTSGNVLVYEMKFSIPECGTVSEALYKIIQLLDIVPICEVVDQMVSFMDWNRSYTYIGFQNLEKRETLEIECPSNDSRQEVTIPCRGEYENTTTIPIYSTGVTQPSASISEITTLVSCGTIWIRTFGIIAILPSSSLFINVFFL
nr:unnamed protein product [Fasciola hepatica]